MNFGKDEVPSESVLSSFVQKLSFFNGKLHKLSIITNVARFSVPNSGTERQKSGHRNTFLLDIEIES